jgi:uncharacterized membrane protein
MLHASHRFIRAVRSSIFAALTAIFARSGIQGVDADWAPLVLAFP